MQDFGEFATQARRLSRETLCTMFWPDSDESQSRSNLRQTLKLARRAFRDRERAIIIGLGDDLVLSTDEVQVDAECFEQLGAAESEDVLEKAAALYQGDFLGGTTLADGPFEEWAIIERAQLRERALAINSRLLKHYRDIGDNTAAIRAALRLLAIEPLLESTHRALIETYLDQGRIGMARAQYRCCKDMLQRELGLDPDMETRRLMAEYRPFARPRTGNNEGYTSPGPSRIVNGSASVDVDEMMSRPAVAVLTFRDHSGDSENTGFADGLCTDITTALGCWRTFPVVPRASTRTVMSADDLTNETTGSLRIGYLVTGDVRLRGERRRITVRLIERSSGRQIWAENFDVDLSDLLSAEDELARQISALTVTEVQRAEQMRIARTHPRDLASWEFCISGMALLERCTLSHNARARSCFEKALAKAPEYSDALAGLAFGHLRDLFQQKSSEREAAIHNGEAAAQMAVALDCNSSLGHHALATAHVWGERAELMILETELAVELNPSNSSARMALGNRLDLIGRTKPGIRQMTSAMKLTPRDPRRFVFMGFLSCAYLSIGEVDAALGWARQAVRLRPDLPDPHFRLALCLGSLGLEEEALACLCECERLHSGFLRGRRKWKPYENRERSDRVLAGLKRHDRLRRMIA